MAGKEMRHAALCIRGLPVVEDIANTSHGPDQGLLPRSVYLAAQPVDVDIDDIRVRLIRIPQTLSRIMERVTTRPAFLRTYSEQHKLLSG